LFVANGKSPIGQQPALRFHLLQPFLVIDARSRSEEQLAPLHELMQRARQLWRHFGWSLLANRFCFALVVWPVLFADGCRFFLVSHQAVCQFQQRLSYEGPPLSRPSSFLGSSRLPIPLGCAAELISVFRAA